MKYRNELDKILNISLDKYKKDPKICCGTTSWTETSGIIYVALRNPTKGVHQLCKDYNKLYGTELETEDFHKILCKLCLDSHKKREIIFKRVKDAADHLFLLLEGDAEAFAEWKSYTERFIEKVDRKKYWKAKCTLVYIFLIDSRFKQPHLQVIGEEFSENGSQFLLNQITKRFARIYGLKTSTNDVINTTKDVFVQVKQTEEAGLLKDKDAQIEALQNQLDIYKNAMEVLETMLDEIKENAEESLEEEKQSVIRQFFISLNSLEYGNILDTLQTAKVVFDENRIDLMKNQPHLMPMAMITRQLSTFIRGYGIRPIEKVGTEFEAAVDAIENMNYEGEAFVDDEEVKKLKIKTSGWKYKDMIISVPTVTEI
ncbi:MAG: nucleotide exchange factor GrpE [bacterium]|nr:nucleotide exchange factor GrpE [bacterium]